MFSRLKIHYLNGRKLVMMSALNPPALRFLHRCDIWVAVLANNFWRLS